MVKLSVVIITLNEEQNIEKCILSVKPIADEIIVLDSFSTDKTKEICKKNKVKFFEKEWMGYSKSKNYANALTENDLIFSIDADEVVSEKLKQSILDIKKQQNINNAFEISRLTNFCGSWIKYCGWYPDKALRIWNKNEGAWKGDIHEKVVLNKGVEKMQLKGDLLHYSFRTIEQHINTINKFSSIAANQRFDKGKKTNALRILFKPFFKFLHMYFIKLGFLDGYHGFVICKNSAFSAFLKEIKLKELTKAKL